MSASDVGDWLPEQPAYDSRRQCRGNHDNGGKRHDERCTFWCCRSVRQQTTSFDHSIVIIEQKANGKRLSDDSCWKERCVALVRSYQSVSIAYSFIYLSPSCLVCRSPYTLCQTACFENFNVREGYCFSRNAQYAVIVADHFGRCPETTEATSLPWSLPTRRVLRLLLKISSGSVSTKN